MKTSLWTAGVLGAFALVGLAPAAQAEDSAWGPFTAGMSLTSDYRFRGISNSDRDAAVQGWVQYDHASGAYANIWASSIDFNDTATYDSSVEVDLTAGYNFKLPADTNAGVKVVYYWYADADTSGRAEYDYWELIANASHEFGKVTATGEVAFSPDYFGEVGDAWTTTGGASINVTDSFLFFTDGLDASAHVGYQWIDDNTLAGIPDYLFYDFGFTANWGSTSFDVRWVDTDVKTSECFAVTNNCEGGIVLTLSATLP